MLKVQTAAERHVYPGPGTPSPMAVAAVTQVDAFPDQTKLPQEEIAFRFIQNVGAGSVYYKFGGPASAADFNGILAPSAVLDINGYGPGAQLDCSAHRQRVGLWSPVGTSVAVTLLFRNDIGKNNSGAYLISP